MKLAIIGPGLVGRSVALAARRADPGLVIIEIDRDESLDAARGANLIVLATPIDVILDIIRHQSDVLRTAVSVDTGSTKRTIVAAAREAGLTTFIGGHPMAGGAVGGAKAAREDLFDQRPWFLVPHGAPNDALDTVRTFVEGLRARPVVMGDDGSDHDHVMAAVSHLPQVVSSLLMVTAAESAGAHLGWGGNGLRDTTRLADSAGSVWQSVLQTNADAVAPLLRTMARHLDAVAAQLESGSDVRPVFDAANRARALI